LIGPVSKRDLWLVGALGVLAVNVVVGWHFYDVGKRNVALKATRDSLSVVVAEKKVIQKQRDSVGAALAIAAKKSAVTRTVYVDTKNETQIKGDSAYDSTGHFIQVLDPRITHRIVAADAHVTQLESELSTAKFAIHVDTVFIAKQAQETKLNQNIADMVSGSRFSGGLQVGVGECLGSDGVKRACIYAGVGLNVRLP
jgi:hypothetical protein